MIWFIPFLITTAVFSVVTFLGILFMGIESKKDMKYVYIYYGLSLVIFYCIFITVKIIKEM